MREIALSSDATPARPAMRTRGLLARLLRDRAGNTIMLVAAGIAPLLAIIGGGIDLGRSYLSETRLQAACDAGVLAARKKLGSEVVTTGLVPASVGAVGDKYFNLNYRNGIYGTTNRSFVMTLNEDYSIGGEATVDVPTTIMKIFAFEKVPLKVNCQSQLNFNNTDVMMVLDTTGSMNQTNPGDTQPKISVLRTVVKNFYLQLQGSKSPTTRVRYGFVPYSSAVNVGALLQDDWVADNWTYQSRELDHTAASASTFSYDDNWVSNSGNYNARLDSTYAATAHPGVSESDPTTYTCDTAAPTGDYTKVDTVTSTTVTAYTGPPSGDKTVAHHNLKEQGTSYWLNLSGATCQVWRGDYHNLDRDFDRITIPAYANTTYYHYGPIARDVTRWRTETAGCIEERGTYEITDYNNVDFTRAKDLDLDTLPTAGQPDTQWRPAYPAIIYERSLNYYGSGSFSVAPVVSTDAWLFQPNNWSGYAACPTASRKLAEMSGSDVDTYLASLTPSGATYHDIGMIWGGRLISPTGLFASENADEPGKTTSRHLIFLTDGLTAPTDLVYSSYGVEPLDRRRWSPTSSLTLTQVVENRFTVACNEVKRRNVTVWVIGFGTTMTDMLKNCAGSGHWFQADDATQLSSAFAKIVASIGDLRITR